MDAYAGAEISSTCIFLEVKILHVCFRPMTKMRLLFILSTLFSITIAQSSIYYVATNGVDTSSGGGIVTPWRTINYGGNRLNPGDTLYIRGGTYAEQVNIYNSSGTSNNLITIVAYPGEHPVIDGAGLKGVDWASMFTVVGNYIHVDNLEIKNCNMGGTNVGGFGIDLSGHHNTVSWMNVHHCWENGIIAKGDYSIVEYSWVWQNCQAKSWSSGLSAARDNVDGITDNAIIRHNTVYNNWGEGLSSYEANGTIIEDNVVYDNWSVNLYISDSRNVLAQRNLVYHSTNAIDPNCKTIVLADERADKPRSANNTVINNFCYGSPFQAFSWTVTPSGLNNVLIANNTLVNARFETGAYPGSGITNTSATIKNNIFFKDSGNPWAANDVTHLAFSNNLWSLTPPASISGGASDVIGNPQLARTGSTAAGQLSVDYFKLLASSPAINKAVSLAAVANDFFATSRGILPDIGGHEFTPATNSVNIIYSVSGKTLNLYWPADHLGWTLQTNSVNVANDNYWFPYPGSAALTNVTITINPAITNVFYRLVY
jgi:hypothetical protein